jgi:hypothetical protein
MIPNYIGVPAWASLLHKGKEERLLNVTGTGPLAGPSFDKSADTIERPLLHGAISSDRDLTIEAGPIHEALVDLQQDVEF